MPSIANGLFAARTGLSSTGQAIAVRGDNVANSNTLGFKDSRAEFADLVAGGQGGAVRIGSGATITATTTIFNQGTIEFTGRAMDIAIDGNGLFVVANGNERFYTRAGNFKISQDGEIVTQDGLALLGFPTGGSGALAALNVNTISQANVNTSNVDIIGNLDSTSTLLSGGAGAIPAVSAANAGTPSTTSYTALNNSAAYRWSYQAFDSLGAQHTITMFAFHTAANTWVARAYVNSDDVDTTIATGVPRVLQTAASATDFTLNFQSDGTLASTSVASRTLVNPWNNGSNAAGTITIDLSDFTQFASSSNITSIVQDGQGVGNVSSLSIENNGDVFAVLDNGQTATIGTLALANFANTEALKRLGGQLYQQSVESGAPVVGTPESGTLGALESGSVELSTVDIANEFVALITLQKNFQANARVITTINQLMSEIIQLV